MRNSCTFLYFLLLGKIFEFFCLFFENFHKRNIEIVYDDETRITRSQAASATFEPSVTKIPGQVTSVGCPHWSKNRNAKHSAISGMR